MILISNLSKSFGDLQVLKDINLQIDDGDIYGLVGESGSGKSTLLRCINGLTSYDLGTIEVDGLAVKDLSKSELRAHRKNMGMVFQHFSLLSRLNVYENVALPLRIWNVDEATIKKQVVNMLELVGLTDKIKSMPRELSGGQKQRVAIARSLVLEPKFLLSDESTSALDPKIGKSILSLLKKINEELGLSVIVVTHQMEVVRQTCDKMALLNNGKIVVDDKVSSVFLKNPAFFQELLGVEHELATDPDADYTTLRVLIQGAKNYENFFGQLSNAAAGKFRFLSGGVDEYRSGSAFLGAISVQNKQLDASLKLLHDNQVPFELVEREG